LLKGQRHRQKLTHSCRCVVGWNLYSDVGLSADGAAVYRERATAAEKAEVDAERASARTSALGKVSKKDIRVALKGVEEAGA
jgi:hypothetical protein